MSNKRTAWLETGVPNLDLVLGGGIPDGDLLLIVGSPGAGKTTLTFQTAFHTAKTGRRVIYVSTLSEPASRLLKHIRSYSFWEERLLGKNLFLDSVYPVVEEGVANLTDALVESVKERDAQLLILDGFMTIRDLHPESVELRVFVNELAVRLAPLKCTAIITSSNIPDMRGPTPAEFTMCDAIVELSQQDVGATTVRMLRAWKVRGAPSILGNHTMRLTQDGLAVYPRVETLPLQDAAPKVAGPTTIGIAELDQLASGGLPRGGLSIVAGAPGTGKTLLALQYLVEGAKKGEPGLFFGFRESTEQLLDKAKALGVDLAGPLAAGLIKISRRTPFDLRFDQVTSELWSELATSRCVRLAVDSLYELESSVLEEPRRRAVMAALAEGLRLRGITTLFCSGTSQAVGPQLDFAQTPLEVFAENVLLLRSVELDGQLVRIISILKMRDVGHDHSIREYTIDGRGLSVLTAAQSASGVLSRIAKFPSERRGRPGGTSIAIKDSEDAT